MNGFTFDISDVEEECREFAQRLYNQEANAVVAGAEVFMLEIKNRAPAFTGNLKRNIVMTKPFKVGFRVRVKVGPTDYSGRSYSEYSDLMKSGISAGDIKNDAHYARYVEFGTIKMRARPFVEPAFLAKKKDAIQAMAEVMKEAVDGV